MYDEFINGRNPRPLIDILNKEESDDWLLSSLLNRDESFKNEENKKYVTPEQKIKELYNAIFVDDYMKMCSKNLGDYVFNNESKNFIISVSSMLSNYADYNI